jgi:hypothetical protein
MMGLSTTQKYGLGAATVAGLYFLRRGRRSGVPTFEKNGKTYFGSSPSLIGINAQPGVAGFHPMGATFSTWAQTTTGPASTSGDPIGVILRVALTPVGNEPIMPQEWIRDYGTGPTALGTPYSGEYESSLPILRIEAETEADLLDAIKRAVYATIANSRGIVQSFPTFGPLVLTSGAPGSGISPELAIAEYDFDGEDPRP